MRFSEKRKPSRGKYVKINSERGYGDDMWLVVTVGEREATIQNGTRKLSFYHEHLHMDIECMRKNREELQK